MVRRTCKRDSVGIGREAGAWHLSLLHSTVEQEDTALRPFNLQKTVMVTATGPPPVSALESPDGRHPPPSWTGPRPPVTGQAHVAPDSAAFTWDTKQTVDSTGV